VNGLLESVQVGTEDGQYRVIWLHGLGADGHDFEPIVDELTFANKSDTRFIFPHAPVRAVTINSGIEMRAWYDIVAMQINEQQDEAGMRKSAQQIEALIENEIAQGYESENILLAGFSQGGAIALHVGLRYSKPLAGIMALSTYLPLYESVDKERHAANQNIPIFYAHGSHDPVIPIGMAEASKDYLLELGYKVQWQTYRMEHSVVPDEIDAIAKFLSQTLS